MSDNSVEKKLEKLHEFFSIEHAFNINAIPLNDDESIPDMAEFIETMPYAFKMASEVNVIEAHALRPIRAFGGNAEALVDFLNHQSRKIDMLMTYVLAMQDDEEFRFRTHSFGGGGLTFLSEKPIPADTRLKLKIFLIEEATAVYCFGEVLQCEAVAGGHQITTLFTRIREEDREVLVRASLHMQTKQLKKLAQQREDNASRS